MRLRITGASVLLQHGFEEVDVSVEDGIIAALGTGGAVRATLDASGLTLLPGIVDIHGDAFERQLMPRPGVAVAHDIALIDSDRQAIANGITTVFHGVTWSWEPGLRGPENARELLSSVETLRSRLFADTRFHLRHETFNLAAEPEVSDWIAQGRVDIVAFNDHMPSVETIAKRPDKIAVMVDRSGIPREDFVKLLDRLRARAEEVPHSVTRIAEQAIRHRVPLLSHDDGSPDQRRWFRERGCRVSEFPINIDTARVAAEGGDHIVLGAPNVMRGGSHVGWVNASDMIARGYCSVLASDYYYPALFIAAFRLVADDVASLEKAWPLVSSAPAEAAGLEDRGRIEAGQRADLLLVDCAAPGRPQIVAVIANGRMVSLNQVARLHQ